MPDVARISAQQKQSAAIVISFQRYWWVSFALIPLAALALPIAIPFVFGDAYAGAILPAEILLPASLFAGARVILTGGALAMGNAWLGSIAELAALFVTVISLSVLLPLFNITGAAIATLLAYATALAVAVYGLKRYHSIQGKKLFAVEWRNIRDDMFRIWKN